MPSKLTFKVLHKITNEQKIRNASIKIRYPGKTLNRTTDTGLGPIRRIDRANMGEKRND